MGCLKASIDSQIGYCSFLELVTLNLPQQLANEVAIYLLIYLFGLFDRCVKQCRPTINRNFILLNCSNKKTFK